MQRVSSPMTGVVIHEGTMPGYSVSYRFHLTDPKRFTERIRVAMEHGHANHLSDDWSSTAYWYQTPPCMPFSILPVQERLPLHFNERPSIHQRVRSLPTAPLTEEMREAKANWQSRYDEYVEARNAMMERRSAQSRDYAQRNIEQASRLRQSYR